MWRIVGLISLYVIFSSCISPYVENDRVAQPPEVQLQDDDFSDQSNQKLPWDSPKFFYGDLFVRAECQSEDFCSSSYVSSVSLTIILDYCFGRLERDTNSLADAVICARSFFLSHPVGLYSARLTTFSP